jgi:hypothetical protein
MSRHESEQVVEALVDPGRREQAVDGAVERLVGRPQFGDAAPDEDRRAGVHAGSRRLDHEPGLAATAVPTDEDDLTPAVGGRGPGLPEEAELGVSPDE